jgi:hypothetical protein
LKNTLQHDTVEVEEHALAELDVGAVVAKERRLHPDGVPAAAEQLTQDLSPGVLVAFACRVE